MKEIQLSQCKVALVDDEDFETLSPHKWCAWLGGRTFYARRNASHAVGGLMAEYMHRWILERKLGRALARSEWVDHANGDGLDNRRENLRLSTAAQKQPGRDRARPGLRIAHLVKRIVTLHFIFTVLIKYR